MITAEDVAVLDGNAEALGVPPRVLMESSGNAVADVVRDVGDPGDSVVIVCGRGNNGGDGSVAARYLEEFDVSARLLGRPESISTAEARGNWDALTASGVDAEPVPDAATLDFDDAAIVVDAMLGTGVTGALREPERSVAERINDLDATVVAVDTPSGIDVDTGESSGVSVDADYVVTFHDMKPGLADRDDVTVADIGIPDAASTFVGPGDRQRLSRPTDAHKGDFGRVAVVGGGPYTGAPALTAQATLRSGADLATVYTPQSVAETVQSYSENLIVDPLPGDRFDPTHVDPLLDAGSDHDVVVLGPGLGDADATQSAVTQFLDRYTGTVVVDADALDVVPTVESAATIICTPHQGELADMGGPETSDWEQRADAVTDFAADLGCVFLVKGAYDIISDGTTTRVNRTGNPGMTVGGTGDVLAGVTAALAATLDPVHAAALGAYANGAAGDRVVDTQGYGLLATDLLPELPHALWGANHD